VGESELVAAAKAGDQSALASLVDAHTAAAMRLALHLAASRADAEDAVQDAFVKAITHLHQFDSSRRFSPWLLKIVANECHRQWRDTGFRRRFWLGRRRDDVDEHTPEAIVIDRFEQQALYSAFRRLRHDDRLLLALTYFEGWHEADVAELLQVPLGTVKSRKHHALARLRRVAAAAPGVSGGSSTAEVTR
jgi:RNA polymerase sigma-70 factor (ECF subfamily)